MIIQAKEPIFNNTIKKESYIRRISTSTSVCGIRQAYFYSLKLKILP